MAVGKVQVALPPTGWRVCEMGWLARCQKYILEQKKRKKKESLIFPFLAGGGCSKTPETIPSSMLKAKKE
jgi:hypothetical protein